jgi:hypothetical protein
VDCFAKEDSRTISKKRADTKTKNNSSRTVHTELKCYSQLGLVKPYTILVRRYQQQERRYQGLPVRQRSLKAPNNSLGMSKEGAATCTYSSSTKNSRERETTHIDSRRRAATHWNNKGRGQRHT